MVNAAKDDNRVSTVLATLDSDGETPVRLEADPTTHVVIVDDDTTGSDNGNGGRDENRVPVAYAVSESDGETLVALYVNSTGELLIDST